MFGNIQQPDEIFGQALPLTGALHILHNAAKDALGKLDNFKTWFRDPFRKLVSWLNQKQNRDLFKAMCLDPPQVSGTDHSLTTFRLH